MFTFLFVSLFLFLSVETKIRLLTFHYNRPDFIELQHKTFQKFLKEKDDYELIVFNDAVDSDLKNQINLVCKKWGIACIDFPQHLHEQGPLFDYIKSAINPFDWLDQKNGSVRHCQIARYAVENFAINHNDIVGLIDGDMFLIRDFSIREYIKNYDLIASRQTDYYQRGFEYAWLALCFFRPYTLPNKHNFHFDLQIACSPSWKIYLDSGAQTYFYLNDNPSVKYKLIEKISLASLLLKNSQELEQLAFNKYEQVFIRSMQGYKGGQFVSTEFHFNGSFLHISNSRYIDILSCEIDPYFVFFNNILQEETGQKLFLSGLFL